MREVPYCHIMQDVRCGLSYRNCLKSKGINLKENGKEMKQLIKRNISPLFSINSQERLQIQRHKWMSLSTAFDSNNTFA